MKMKLENSEYYYNNDPIKFIYLFKKNKFELKDIETLTPISCFNLFESCKNGDVIQCHIDLFHLNANRNNIDLSKYWINIPNNKPTK